MRDIYDYWSNSPKEKPFVSYPYEDIKISCSSDEIQEKLNRIYKDYYFGVPLQFYPEFVGRKDIFPKLRPYSTPSK